MLNINTQKQKQNQKIKKQKTTTTQYKFNIIAIITCYANYIGVFFLAQITVMDVKKKHTHAKQRKTKQK